MCVRAIDIIFCHNHNNDFSRLLVFTNRDAVCERRMAWPSGSLPTTSSRTARPCRTPCSVAGNVSCFLCHDSCLYSPWLSWSSSSGRRGERTPSSRTLATPQRPRASRCRSHAHKKRLAAGTALMRALMKEGDLLGKAGSRHRLRLRLRLLLGL